MGNIPGKYRDQIVIRIQVTPSARCSMAAAERQSALFIF
jgi:hypothetical protein